MRRQTRTDDLTEGSAWSGGGGSATSKRLRRIALYATLILASVGVAFPFLWMLSTSVTPGADVFSYPPQFVPSTLAPENYVQAFESIDFSRQLMNSLLVAGTATASVLVLDSMAGYAFAKLRFPGRTALFVLVLVTIMIPIQVTIVPLFILFRKFPLVGGNSIWGAGGTGILDSYAALALPFLASTVGTYLMREFFRTVPSSLLDAARVDGASEWRIFSRIFIPLVKPGLAAVGVFHFTFVWNDFLIPLVMTSDRNLRTVQLGLAAFKGQTFTQWHLLMAATGIATLPIFIVFLLGQRYLIRGIALTGIKGGG